MRVSVRIQYSQFEVQDAVLAVMGYTSHIVLTLLANWIEEVTSPKNGL